MKSRDKFIKYTIIFWLGFISFSGCKSYHLRKSKEKFPELFTTKIEETKFEPQDTSFVLGVIDSVVINNETSTTKIFRHYDTIYHINQPYVRIDTTINVNYNIDRIENLENENEVLKSKGTFENYVLLFCIGVLAGLCLFLVTKN